MKKIVVLLVVLVLAAILVIPNVSGRRFSRQWGEQLYENPSIGGSGNDRSCRSCHSKDDAKFHQAILNRTKEELIEIINRCIKVHLKGQPFPEKAPELISVRLYLNYLATSSLD